MDCSLRHAEVCGSVRNSVSFFILRNECSGERFGKRQKSTVTQERISALQEEMAETPGEQYDPVLPSFLRQFVYLISPDNCIYDFKS